MARGVLDVVPEDPQEQHVAAEMHPATVQEHRGEHGDQRIGGPGDVRTGTQQARRISPKYQTISS